MAHLDRLGDARGRDRLHLARHGLLHGPVLAGLQTVPRELHEAARVDGANVWERFWNVTIPCLRPTMFFVVVILTINSFKIFDLILVMTNGGPGQATTVLSQFIYRKGFQRTSSVTPRRPPWCCSCCASS